MDGTGGKWLAITDYDVRYCEGTGACTTWTAWDVTATALSTTITGLTNGTPYQVQVRAVNSQSNGAWSASGTGTPTSGARVPDAPSAPTVAAANASLGVTWTAPTNNGAPITDYDVRYCEGTDSCDDADWKKLPRLD